MKPTERIEEVILQNLLIDDTFSRNILPFIKGEYFENFIERTLYEHISEFVIKYDASPSPEAILISINNSGKLNQTQFEEVGDVLNNMSTPIPVNKEWLIEQTEKFCKDRAIYLAIFESIQILDGKSSKSANCLPELLSDALAVTFDTHIGHDFIEDSDSRFESYHRVEDKIPFDLDFFNKITAGGITPKTLNVVMAGTGVGKSLFLCHHATNCLLQNKNVLYITCEMAEEKIAERIDANIMDISLDDLKIMNKDKYDKLINASTKSVTGKLIIKEYPTATASVVNFRHLLDELLLKKRFTPDIIFVDYLNICASSRFRDGSNTNSYMYVKAIAEELRGLAVEYVVPIFTATQTNRAGFANTDVGLEDTSESFGLPATADFMFALIATDELDEKNQIMVKQLKNRYNDVSRFRKFLLGVDRSKMKLYDTEKNDNDNLLGTQGPATIGFDDRDFEERFKEPEVELTKETYSDWKI